MFISHLTADSWLWTARLADPATGHVCNDRPIRAARWEGSGLSLVGIYELDLPVGTLLVTTPAGMSSQGAGPWGGNSGAPRRRAATGPAMGGPRPRG